MRSTFEPPDTESPRLSGGGFGTIRLCVGSGRGAERGSDLADVGGLEPLGPLDDLELHAVALGKRAEAFGDDCGVMNEDVLATILCDEAEPLCVIEPLDRALRHCCNLLKREPVGPGGKPPAGVAGFEKKPQKKAARINIRRLDYLRIGREAPRIACHKVMLGNGFVNGWESGVGSLESVGMV